MGEPLDTFKRPLRDLRVSVTDRCNFRCVYCMPKEVFGKDFQFLPRAEILSFEEIERLVRVFVGLGVQKVRLTGGEPLVRRNIERLVEMLAKVDRELPLEPIEKNYPGEVAERWRYRDGSGEIGVIASVTQAFCADCTRARLSADGSLYTCLFATQGHDLRGLVRGEMNDAQIAEAIAAIWTSRDDRYSELRSA